MIKQYNETQLKDELEKLNSSTDLPWVIENDKLFKTFKFQNFATAKWKFILQPTKSTVFRLEILNLLE
jgi:pterin-4a-carbinolamine dehydratase